MTGFPTKVVACIQLMQRTQRTAQEWCRESREVVLSIFLSKLWDLKCLQRMGTKLVRGQWSHFPASFVDAKALPVSFYWITKSQLHVGKKMVLVATSRFKSLVFFLQKKSLHLRKSSKTLNFRFWTSSSRLPVSWPETALTWQDAQTSRSVKVTTSFGINIFDYFGNCVPSITDYGGKSQHQIWEIWQAITDLANETFGCCTVFPAPFTPVPSTTCFLSSQISWHPSGKILCSSHVNCRLNQFRVARGILQPSESSEWQE